MVPEVLERRSKCEVLSGLGWVLRLRRAKLGISNLGFLGSEEFGKFGEIRAKFFLLKGKGTERDGSIWVKLVMRFSVLGLQ